MLDDLLTAPLSSLSVTLLTLSSYSSRRPHEAKAGGGGCGTRNDIFDYIKIFIAVSVGVV